MASSNDGIDDGCVPPEITESTLRYIIEGSKYEEINGSRIIDRAGKVKLALGEGVLTGDEVTGFTLFNKGRNYPQNVIVKFNGGGGSGALWGGLNNPWPWTAGMEALSSGAGGSGIVILRYRFQN